ncbi:MAG TPA: response regulator [Myxococcales bacterium]|jgi:CheY-like chemotaxis protein
MRRLRVLVADDDPDLRNWLRLVLGQRGMVVLEAESGVELLERLASSGPFDLVVADVRMSWASGLQALAMARDAGFALPFLVITSHVDDAVRRAVAALDAPLLPKPFTVAELLEAAGKALRQNKAAAAR